MTQVTIKVPKQEGQLALAEAKLVGDLDLGHRRRAEGRRGFHDGLQRRTPVPGDARDRFSAAARLFLPAPSEEPGTPWSRAPTCWGSETCLNCR